MTMPPLAASVVEHVVGRVRTWSDTARHDECEKITGARDDSRASRIVVGGDVGDVDQHADPVHLGAPPRDRTSTARRRPARRWRRRPTATFWLWVSVM